MFKKNKKGFSLIEVLVAISIIAVVIVPLAMNLISGARMNNKAKKVSASTDLSTSIIETLQTVDLGDIMVELNSSFKGDGAPSTDKDQYYGDVSKALLQSLQEKGFNVSDVNMFETKKQDNGSYSRIVNKSESSVLERVLSNNSVKNYFVGQADNEYSFVLKNVKNGEMTVDIVANIEGIHSYDLVNITSMQHSDAFYVKQPTSGGQSTMEQSAAENFFADHKLYSDITGQTSNLKDVSWFLNNMQRSIVVDIVQEKNTDAVTMTISIEYTLKDNNVLQESDQKIVKTLGSFTTNSTAEFSKGLHIYFNPLNNAVNKNQRDTFIVNNKNDVNIPVYFIALEQDNSVGFNKLLYRPSIKVVESSNAGISHTTICTNLIENKYEIAGKLNVLGNKETVVIKTIGNATTQQILYSIELQVYNHTEASHAVTGEGTTLSEVFTPRQKDLLSEVQGTFIDTSEKIDVNADAGANSGRFAYARGLRNVYSGLLITGVDYGFCTVDGPTQMTDAGVYTVVAVPNPGYTWEDGTTEQKTVTWEITRAPVTKVEFAGTEGQLTYNATEQSGFSVISEDLLDPATGEFKQGCFSGVYKARNAGTYTASFTPDSNHCWEDGSIVTKTFTWTINKRHLTVSWPTGENLNIWVYDGTTHSIHPTISGILPGDTCDFTVRDNFIKDVGFKMATIASLSNNNYTVVEGKEHRIEVVANRSASYTLKLDANNKPILVYDGTAQDIVIKSQGVRFRGDRTMKNANTYTLIAEPMEGYVWEGTESDRSQRVITWQIAPKEVSFQWGDATWTYDFQIFDYYDKAVPLDLHPKTYQKEYDNQHHTIPCVVLGLIEGDTCTPILENHIIQEEGVYPATVVGLSNSNYKVANNFVCLIEIVPKPVADVTNYSPKEPIGDKAPFQYTGMLQTGVVGTCVDIVDNTAINVNANHQTGFVECYKALATPKHNYSWGETEWTHKPVTVLLGGQEVVLDGGLPIGSKYTVVVEWIILPIEDAWYEDYIITYDGLPQNGVSFENATCIEEDNALSGVTKINVSEPGKPYVAKLRPDANHAWVSRQSAHAYDVGIKEIEWYIVNSSMTMPQIVGDYPVYNGTYQYPNALIFTNFGTQSDILEFYLYSGNGTSGTKLAGPSNTVPKAINAGTYTLVVRIKDEFKHSYSWEDENGNKVTNDVQLVWKILKKEITNGIEQEVVDGSKNLWTYDNKYYYGSAKFKDNFLVFNEETQSYDQCTLTYSSNYKQINAGTYKFSITAVSNNNYTATYNELSDKSGQTIYDSLSMTIKKRPLTVTWSTGNRDLTWNSTWSEWRGINGTNAFQNSGKITASFNLGSHTPASGKTPTPILSSTTTQTTPGKYDITITGINNNDPANYEFASGADLSESFVVWKDAAGYNGMASRTYNGKTQYAAVNNSAFAYVYSGTTSAKNAGSYSVKLRANSYYYWGGYGVKDDFSTTWTIKQLPASSVKWTVTDTSFSKSVLINTDSSGEGFWDESTGSYMVSTQSVGDILGKFPDITVDRGDTGITYYVKYTPSSTAGHISGFEKNVATTDLSTFRHGGTYTFTATFPGNSNIASTSKEYTVTLTPINFSTTKFPGYVPTFTTKDNQDKVIRSVGTKGYHALEPLSRYASSYSFKVEITNAKDTTIKGVTVNTSNVASAGTSATTKRYCPPLQYTKPSSGDYTSNKITWKFLGNADINAYTGTKTVSVDEDRTAVFGNNGYASCSLSTYWNVAKQATAYTADLYTGLITQHTDVKLNDTSRSDGFTWSVAHSGNGTLTEALTYKLTVSTDVFIYAWRDDMLSPHEVHVSVPKYIDICGF